jgi:hypothetical protein
MRLVKFGPFTFLKRYTDLGVGAMADGLLRPQTLPPNTPYLGNTGRRQWNVQRSMKPISAPGFMMVNQQVIPVPITGTTGGYAIPGQLISQPLAQIQKGGSQ